MRSSVNLRKWVIAGGLVLILLGCFSPPNALAWRWENLVKGAYHIYYRPSLKWMAKNLPTGKAFFTVTNSVGNWGTNFSHERNLIASAKKRKIRVFLQQDRRLMGNEVTGDYRMWKGSIILNVSGALTNPARDAAGAKLAHETSHYFFMHTIGPGGPLTHWLYWAFLPDYEETCVTAVTEGLAMYYELCEYRNMKSVVAKSHIRGNLKGAAPLSWYEVGRQYMNSTGGNDDLLAWRLASIGYYWQWGIWNGREVWRFMRYAFRAPQTPILYTPICHEYSNYDGSTYWTWDYHGSQGRVGIKFFTHVGDRVVDWALSKARSEWSYNSDGPSDLKGVLPSRIDGAVIEGNETASMYMNYCAAVYEDPW
ncbi:hypothetical protein ACFL2Q_12445 [Thermodesulfobacteriota bacterium]